MSCDIIGIEESHGRSLLMNMKSWELIFLFDIYDNPGSQNLGFEDNLQNRFFLPIFSESRALQPVSFNQPANLQDDSSSVLVQFEVIFQIASKMFYGDFEGKVPKRHGQVVN
ncbi:10733_t:CDS:2 [Gigaspora rosea]|nr:10733_t:CDS:2 [Gigaspora rosea]